MNQKIIFIIMLLLVCISAVANMPVTHLHANMTKPMSKMADNSLFSEGEDIQYMKKKYVVINMVLAVIILVIIVMDFMIIFWEDGFFRYISKFWSVIRMMIKKCF